MMPRHNITEFRPWGNFERFTLNEKSTVKILTIYPKESPSVQYHHKRDEFWKVIKGKILIRLGDKEIEAIEGDEFVIPRKMIHTATAVNQIAKILEISFGDFDEEDIVRLEDKYGRIK